MKYFVTILVVLVLGLGAFLLFGNGFDGSGPDADNGTTSDNVLEPRDGERDDTATTSDDENTTADSPETIGQSAGGLEIEAYHYGDGETELLVVGGIHGAYSWNTTKLSYDIINWLEEDPGVVPDNMAVTVIPVLNPDGLMGVAGTTTDQFTAADMPAPGDTIPGRFNASDVDLNRNFDCNWQTQGMWQNRTVDAGSSAFSEPETRALRDYVEANDPAAAIVYYAAAGGVYSSSCNSGVLSETEMLMNMYANASNYPAEGEFTAYEITGDAVDWLAKIGVPGISVLLTNHEDVEWEMNRAGLEAVFSNYAE